MNILLYDKTFDGFLSLIFEAFKNKIVPHRIEGFDFNEPLLWTEKISIVTDPSHSNRVWEALKKKLSPIGYNAVYRIQLSGMPDAEMVLFRFLQKVFVSPVNIEENYSDPDVLMIKKMARQVGQETERMNQFIRFQKTADGIYFAAVDPQYNVIPLIVKHLETRFADQQWIVYDSKRNYGFYYNCVETVLIKLSSDKINPEDGKINDDVLAEDELLFQKLWKQYFKSISIDERKNLRLQRQHMPKRYWKYLTEKQG